MRSFPAQTTAFQDSKLTKEFIPLPSPSSFWDSEYRSKTLSQLTGFCDWAPSNKKSANVRSLWAAEYAQMSAPNPKYQNKHDGILWIQWVLYHGIFNIYKAHDITIDHKCRTSAFGRAGKAIWASDCAFARSDATTSSDAWRQHPIGSRNGSRWSGLIQWIWQMDANVPDMDFVYDISEFNSIQKN